MTNRPAEPGRTARLPIVRSAMFGHAIADAMGVPVEFSTRSQRRCDPVTGYRGYGAHDVPAGTWSDDTSMALATIDSLAHGLDTTGHDGALLRLEAPRRLHSDGRGVRHGHHHEQGAVAVQEGCARAFLRPGRRV